MHGDDFTCCGPKHHVDWYESMLSTRYELSQGGRSGPGSKDLKEATVRNRVVLWAEQGLEYEAEPREVGKLHEEVFIPDDGVKTAATS